MHARGTLINLWASQFFIWASVFRIHLPNCGQEIFCSTMYNCTCVMYFLWLSSLLPLSPGGPSAGHPRAGPPVRLHRAGGVHLELPARHPQHPQRLPHLRTWPASTPWAPSRRPATSSWIAMPPRSCTATPSSLCQR